jgi:hypothetical protein
MSGLERRTSKRARKGVFRRPTDDGEDPTAREAASQAGDCPPWKSENESRPASGTGERGWTGKREEPRMRRDWILCLRRPSRRIPCGPNNDDEVDEGVHTPEEVGQWGRVAKGGIRE